MRIKQLSTLVPAALVSAATYGEKIEAIQTVMAANHIKMKAGKLLLNEQTAAYYGAAWDEGKAVFSKPVQPNNKAWKDAGNALLEGRALDKANEAFEEALKTYRACIKKAQRLVNDVFAAEIHKNIKAAKSPKVPMTRGMKALAQQLSTLSAKEIAAVAALAKELSKQAVEE